MLVFIFVLVPLRQTHYRKHNLLKNVNLNFVKLAIVTNLAVQEIELRGLLLLKYVYDITQNLNLYRIDILHSTSSHNLPGNPGSLLAF